MRIMITGGAGQLGQALVRQLAARHELFPVDVEEFDITEYEAVRTGVDEVAPDLAIHTAAYTDVDGCARDPALAQRVNGLGTQNIALACQAGEIPLVHISTNEVFDGSAPAGFPEWHPLCPTNPYGASKAAAEFHVRHLVPRHYIVRIAWLFAPGGRNFIHAILDRARSSRPLRVVTDEIGNPTYVADLAAALERLVGTGHYGTYHLTNSGACSRYEFARAICDADGLSDVPITPIFGAEFRRASTPPRFGALQNNAAAALGITLRPWREALEAYLNSDAAPG